MDSLTSMELKNEIITFIGKHYSLPPALIFEFPTLNRLTDYLEELIFNQKESITCF